MVAVCDPGMTWSFVGEVANAILLLSWKLLFGEVVCLSGLLTL